MSAKSLQYITLAIAGVALIVAVVGCFIPTQDTASDDVTALIVNKDQGTVTVSVDADKAGSLEVWCDGVKVWTILYSAGNHVYMNWMEAVVHKSITSLEIRYT